MNDIDVDRVKLANHDLEVASAMIRRLQRLLGRWRLPWPLPTLFDVAQTRFGALRVVHVAVPRHHPGPPLRAVFASDLHVGPTTGPRVLARAAEAIRAARPDLLLLGGDYVFGDARYAEQLASLLGGWRASLGAYGVLGNHDLNVDTERVEAGLAAAGVAVLRNRSACLPPPHDWLRIVGLDDRIQGEPDAAAAFAEVKPGEVVLLLTHHPDAVAGLGEGHQADLILAGHTHGGGVCLPGGLPLLKPSALGYIAGSYATAHGPLVVSRGVGCIELPLRPFTPADIVVISI